MSKTRVYAVKMKRGGKVHLVEAISQEQAVRHVTQSFIADVTIPSPLETAKLIAGGTTLEKAGEQPKPAEQQQDGGQGQESGQGGDAQAGQDGGA